MKNYYVNYNTGAGNFETEDIVTAKTQADEGASYTQETIQILDEKGKEICYRQWIGCNNLDSDLEDGEISQEYYNKCIQFGNAGYYAPWSDELEYIE